MDRRNALISMALLGALLSACSIAPRPRYRPPPAGGSGVAPEDALDAMLQADPDPRRDDVITVALSQVGTPYIWGGGSPAAGFDCSGLVAYVFQQAVRLNLPRVAYEQARSGHPVGKNDLRAADLVFYDTQKHPFSHVGIYVGRARFVHAPAAGALVRIEHMSEAYWRARYDGARRVLS